MKNFPLNKFTLFEELLSYKILDKKNLRDIQTRRFNVECFTKMQKGQRRRDRHFDTLKGRLTLIFYTIFCDSFFRIKKFSYLYVMCLTFSRYMSSKNKFKIFAIFSLIFSKHVFVLTFDLIKD